MKPLLLLMTLSMSICLSQAQPAPAVAMKRGQPFPYTVGMALDQGLYEQLKAKLTLADAVRTSSQQAIAGLNEQIQAHETLQRELQSESSYLDDRQRALQRDVENLKAERDAYQAQLAEAQRVIDAARAALSARLRKKAITPQLLAQFIVEELEKGQKAPLRFGLGGMIVGAILTLIVLL
ncbi:hypothetical protein FAES_3634 [Fibrella aestuarina BUZ 2]|uniref:Uncharacterized protein n=1 Tax=Fibrella aestuarina BUZ 2 TaxID=1166018 RepID=I0KBY8_9BACT|nr:exodeoxyribonuclease V subunit gamma [Fibrella aestuarina]CCH01641.1 hypothetical protein FAES_3634 [Fibrella aestuarina BUZ 2]